ncbi:MAG: mechanosensitive ion channel family protein [Candidatus Thermoplasmatota archaeon]
MVEFKKILCIVALILIISAPVISLSSGTAEGQPVVGGYDDYERTVKRGEKATFNWTVERVEDLDYTVTAETEGFEEVEKKITPSWFILDERNPNKVVMLTVELPMFPDSDRIEGSVNFSFYREGEMVDHQVENITIDVGGLPDKADANTLVVGFRNPLPSPLDGPFGAFLLNLLIWFSIAVAGFFLVTPFLHHLAKKTKTELDDLLVKMIRRPLLLFIFLYGFIHSLIRLDLPFEIRATLYQLYSLLALVIGAYIAYRILDGVLEEISFKRGGEETPFANVLKPIFEKLAVIVILLAGAVIGLSILGVEVTALLAGAGVLGLVVAFAAQDTLSNFFSGMHLLLDRPFTIGDVLELESGEYCRVEDVGMRSTKLYNIRAHEMIVLPNNSIANQQIKNLAEPDEKKRVGINVGVEYGSDIGKVKEILHEVIEDQENVIMGEEGREPVVLFSDFGESSLKFILRFWIDDYLEQWTVASRIRDRIDEEFRDAEVTIPFPQRTVWLKNDEGEEETKS